MVFLFQKSKLHKTEVTLNLKTFYCAENSNVVKISDDSLEELRRIISDESVKKLVEEFDKEKIFYINFITIVSIFLTMVGIISAVYGLFEKNENIKIREDLEKLNNEYRSYIDEITIKGVVTKLRSFAQSLRENDKHIYLLEDKNIVKTIDDLESYIITLINKQLDYCNITLLCDKFLDSFSIEVRNLLLAVIIYIEDVFKIKCKKENDMYSVVETSILKSIMYVIKFKLDKEKFIKLIDAINLLPNKTFDFKGLM